MIGYFAIVTTITFN